ncbi:MAG TPA: phosphoglucosamine mutase [Solirubrobacterales bacterium]|jgi:phosphoglucosamine mutase|nr:phosphoglucosamine mutase [Solirubrobacterales bacterium]
MMGRKLFGTDGVRGEAGTFLTAELATSLGRAATASLEAERPQVLIVRDTRESGPMLESALAAGIAAAGGDALLGGVLPTPAAAILVKRLGLDLAAVVSASHNPYRDNGIKFFSAEGTKLDDEAEARIEALIDAEPKAGEPGNVRELNGGLEDYLRALESAFRLDLSDRRVMLDCANGATFRAAPMIFERLGATVEALAAEPDGRNINDGCGSTHLDRLAEAVAASEATIGFAFDGDGDRVLAVDGSGRSHDGDELIALAARGMAARGELGGGVAVTVMSNYGFHQAMEEAGIEVAVAKVGDRYVLDELRERRWALGGEQSGHIIDTRFVATGDGIAAALTTMRELGDRDLATVTPMEKLPQTLVNVEVADRGAIAGAEAVWEAVEREGQTLEGRGRVLLRASGTEPLVRVMVEAPSAAEADSVCGRLVTLVRQELA